MAICHWSGSSINSPTFTLKVVQGALKVTLHRNFSQINWVMFSNALALKPAPCQTASTRFNRSVTPPPISPMRISFMLLWWVWPGPFMEAPKPSATPKRTLSVGMYCAIRSPAPRPFWIVKTIASRPITAAAACAAEPTPEALVARIHRSHVPTSEIWVVARTDVTVRSPLAPSTRRPFALIASTCAPHVSTAQTSCPASASKAA